MDYGNIPTFAGSKNVDIASFSEKLYGKINNKWSTFLVIDDDFQKEKARIVRAYNKLDNMVLSRTDEENDEYYENQRVMLNTERGRIFSLDISPEEKLIRYKEIDEYERYLKFIIYDFHKYSSFLKSKYIDKEIDLAKRRSESKKEEVINEIKKEIELYVKFLNRILIKYDNKEGIYEEYRKISNHKFDDPNLQKVYDDKLYETLMLLPKLYDVVNIYSGKEEYYSNLKKEEQLKSSAADNARSQEDNKRTEDNKNAEEDIKKEKNDNFQKLEFSSDKERIKKIYELLEKSEKEKDRDYMLDAYGYSLSLPDSDEKKKIEIKIYKMVDDFKIEEIKTLLNNNPDEERIKKAKKLIYELAYGPEKSTLIDFVNKLENLDNEETLANENTRKESEFNVYIADENEVPMLNEDGTLMTEDDLIRKQVAEKVTSIRRAS